MLCVKAERGYEMFWTTLLCANMCQARVRQLVGRGSWPLFMVCSVLPIVFERKRRR